MNKKNKKASSFYFLAAACFMLAGIIGIIQDSTMPYMFIGLACANICLGCVNLAKAKKDSDEKDDDEKNK